MRRKEGYYFLRWATTDSWIIGQWVQAEWAPGVFDDGGWLIPGCDYCHPEEDFDSVRPVTHPSNMVMSC